MRVMLDAGHYAKCNQSPLVPEYWESDMTWNLHLYLKEALEAYGIEVGTTREDKEKDLEVTQRGKKAAGYDLFLSLHSNACGSKADWYEGSRYERVNRVVVYRSYLNKNNADVLATALAENIEKVMGVNGHQVATNKSQLGDWEYYGVLRGASYTDCPLYYIIEHSFHTNKQASLWLLNQDNLKKLAQVEADTIAKYFGIQKKPETYLVGDVNGDGKIDAVDYAMVKRIVLGTYKPSEEQLIRADVNGDGKVTALDYAMLKRMVLGSYTPNPKTRIMPVKYSGALPEKELKKGDNSFDVKLLQNFLNWYDNYNLAVDGIFGPLTESAVKQFQKREKIAITGIFTLDCIEKAKNIKK